MLGQVLGDLSDVDLQLIRAANILSCPEWHKFVILLIDEMYIREDLVYNKHTGRLIGFTDLGSINNHLSAFERSINEGEITAKLLAKSMLAIMVKGLFTPLKFPYVQFHVSTYLVICFLTHFGKQFIV